MDRSTTRLLSKKEKVSDQFVGRKVMILKN